nr:EOG090X0MWD [Sida crystallina]
MNTNQQDTRSAIELSETVVNEVLRTELRRCLGERDACCTEINEYLQLQTKLDNLKEVDTHPLKTKVDLGCSFFVQAEIPDVSKILVSVGYGFFLELTHDEAVKFIAKRVALLNGKLKKLDQQSATINADIKIVLDILAQLQNLNVSRQEIEYRITVVEQKDLKPFNRAALFNVGFVEMEKRHPADCYIFHDVDLIPLSLNNIYACTVEPRHISSALDVFDFKLPYATIFGGAVALTNDQFKTVNGFSNLFFGWGGEDDDFYSRVIEAKSSQSVEISNAGSGT